MQMDPRLFFANKFGAGSMVQARFGVDIRLYGYFMARNQCNI